MDTSAIIALLKQEPGAEDVGRVVGTASICSVNAAEVVAVAMRMGMSHALATEAVEALGMTIEPLDKKLAFRAGEFFGSTRHVGLSIGDCSCLALAEALGAEAWAADRRWLDAGLPVRIHLIR